MIELTALLSVATHLASAGVFLDVQGDVKTYLVDPMMGVLQMVIPVAVGLYILYKVVSGHVEHAKMLVAEGVVVAGVLEGVIILAKNMHF